MNFNMDFEQNTKTTHALINITESLREVLGRKNLVTGVFVDLQKAFDTVNHNILLSKLKYYGIRGPINSWFKSYLYNRKQIVTINGYKSEIKVLNHSVPQGSVLGPLLFLLYINNLNISIQNSKVYHFLESAHLTKSYRKN